ncbi:hypothetical protein M427DRAFT_129985 [Gonapodya prolifera JEL478]|uniref:Alkyl hydroperoxide reductase subunit C/ Thiol specific antioxidant domain-containing protein n=1 Tax=Gonapodya prolifera (strain JEL478) TaxID=1344416 RepID=A0A139B0D1_GONPJ|nr:hypothetical protein M427DRAFT_129985 [Gonapodya prolifera JEL478]|eukprot:KXS22263.1 hypothetical protein M427DRAFT_129985 [Gonapodya prolifera JEL478]
MASFLADIASLLPRSSPSVSPAPAVGSPAPSLPSGVEYGNSQGTVVAFVRHCGCPFAEKEIRLLGEVVKQRPGVQVVVVQHSADAETKAWWDRIGGPKLVPDVKLISDPERNVYASFGVGILPWSGLFTNEIVKPITNLKNEGIVNTETGSGSWRWQNSGGFVIDQSGIVRWSKIAAHAGDMCDYIEALKALGSTEK